MQTHTKEPWGCNSKGQIHSGDFHDSDGAAIICRTNNPKDAYRIKACVNACEGIPIESLEQTVYLQNGWSAAAVEIAEKAKGYQLGIERLKAVNAQMLDALQDAEIQIEYLNEKFKPTGSGNKTLALIRAAISAATKTEPNQQTEPDYDNPAEREADAPTPYDP